jgi:hypothetical protein
MTMTSYSSSDEEPSVASHNLSVWHKLFAIIAEGPTPRAEDAIADYLYHHQRDLPAALWIELERRRLVP